MAAEGGIPMDFETDVVNRSEESRGSSWADVDEKMATLILQQGEKILASQVQLAIAADQRAISSANTFVTVAVGVLAATLGYYGVEPLLSVLMAGLIGAGMITTAAICCFIAASPRLIHLPGGHPRSWQSVRQAKMNEAMGGEAENYQEQIDYNDQLLMNNSQWLKAGLLTAVVAPIVSSIVWSMSFLF